MNIHTWLIGAASVGALAFAIGPYAIAQEVPFTVADNPTPYYTNIFPRAVKSGNRTYVTYQGKRPGEPSSDPQTPLIQYFDHSIAEWSEVFIVGDGINRLPNNDDHGNPTLWVEDDGTVHVYWGSHGPSLGSTPRGLRHAKTTNPGDLSNWQDLGIPFSSHTYQQIDEFSSGDLLFYYRSGGHSPSSQTHSPWRFHISGDEGNTFGAATNVTTSNVADLYSIAAIGPDDNVHIFFSHESGTLFGNYANNRNRKDIYHIYRDTVGQWRDGSTNNPVALPIARVIYQDDGGVWRNSRDKSTVTPSTNDVRRLYNTGDVPSQHVPDIAFNGDGTVYLAFVDRSNITNGNETGEGSFSFGKKLPGGSWSFNPIGGTSNHWADIAQIEKVGSDLFAYVTSDGPSNRGRIEQYKSIDGGLSWSKEADLTSANTYATPAMVTNADGESTLVFYRKPDGAMYLWGRDEGYAVGDSPAPTTCLSGTQSGTLAGKYFLENFEFGTNVSLASPTATATLSTSSNSTETWKLIDSDGDGEYAIQSHVHGTRLLATAANGQVKGASSGAAPRRWKIVDNNNDGKFGLFNVEYDPNHMGAISAIGNVDMQSPPFSDQELWEICLAE